MCEIAVGFLRSRQVAGVHDLAPGTMDQLVLKPAECCLEGWIDSHPRVSFERGQGHQIGRPGKEVVELRGPRLEEAPGDAIGPGNALSLVQTNCPRLQDYRE